jgi:hypothetical protein
MGKYLLVSGQPSFRCYNLDLTNGDAGEPIATFNTRESLFDCTDTGIDIHNGGDANLLCAFIDRSQLCM